MSGLDIDLHGRVSLDLRLSAAVTLIQIARRSGDASVVVDSIAAARIALTDAIQILSAGDAGTQPLLQTTPRPIRPANGE